MFRDFQRWLFTLALVFIPTLATAQQPPSGNGYCHPPGGPAGSFTQVQLGGADWTPDSQFFCHDPLIKLEILSKPGVVLMPEPPYWFDIKSYANDPRLCREVSARFHIPPNYSPGPVFWSVANANGIGSSGVFIVGAGNEIAETLNPIGPQTLPSLPITINGRLGKIEEVDRFQLTPDKSGLITCDLMARRLGSDFLGVIEIHDARGAKIAEAFDTEGIDPVLTFFAEKGKIYYLSVRDVDYRGYRNFTYRLSVTRGPRVITTLPASGRPGTKIPVEFIGMGVATGQAKLESVTQEVAFPPKPAKEPFFFTLKTPFGEAIPVRILVKDLPAADPNGTLTPPFALTARMKKKGEQHALKAALKKGEVCNLVVEAHRLGSAVSPSVVILGPDGKVVKDVSGGLPDIHHTWVVAADGDHQLVVTDLSGKTPDASFIYRLAVTRPEPDFQLRTTGTLGLPLGGKADLQVTVNREGGFKEAVTLAIAGLPKGVKVPEKMEIAAKADSIKIPLEVAKDAVVEASVVKITGTAKVADTQVTRVALGSIKGGDLCPREPDAGMVSNLLFATTMKPPFKVVPVEADGGRRVPRGATHLAELKVERNEGFTGEIILDMAGNQSRHRQGIRGPELKVAPGIKKIDYPVFLPEWLETTRTSRIALVAMALIPDPQGKPRWTMAAMDGQVTMSIEGALMKLSISNEEITLSPGDPLSLQLKLAKTPRLTEKVLLELVVPEKIAGLIQAKPFEFPAGQSGASWLISSQKDARLVGTWQCTARATAMRNGHPVVSEVVFDLEFLPAKVSAPK